MCTKGNLLIGQGGGPTSVINASLAGIMSAARKRENIEKIYGLKNGIEGIFFREAYDLTDEPESLIDKLKYTPGAILGTSSFKIKDDAKKEEVVKFFKENNIRYFTFIGGKNSMQEVAKISQILKEAKHDVQIMAVPKACDNNIPITDHSPGYGSAARFIATATLDAGRDLEAMKSLDDVAIMEVMGKESGFLAAASALGRKSVDDAPHLIYMPEKAFNKEQFLEDVKEIYEELKFIFIVVSEGIKDKDGHLIGEETLGPGVYLSKLISEELGLKVRLHKLETIQRSFASNASELDIQEAFIAGQQTIEDFKYGFTDMMITLDRAVGKDYFCTPGRTHLEDAMKGNKYMANEFINQEGNFVTHAFAQYAMPLLGKSLPEYARLDKSAIEFGKRFTH